MKDLISKLAASEYVNNLPDINDNFGSELIRHIQNIIGGKVIFDKKKKDFLFERTVDEKKYQFKSANTATGVKSFSIIQLLLSSGILNDRTLLIIDEPEIHLHPRWQIEYCKLVVELAKNNIHVIVNSHSPYIIQALKVFSSKRAVNVNFLYAQKEKDILGSNIECINNDLNKVFKKLSDPLQEIVWGE